MLKDKSEDQSSDTQHTRKSCLCCMYIITVREKQGQGDSRDLLSSRKGNLKLQLDILSQKLRC